MPAAISFAGRRDALILYLNGLVYQARPICLSKTGKLTPVRHAVGPVQREVGVESRLFPVAGNAPADRRRIIAHRNSSLSYRQSTDDVSKP